MMLKKTCFIMLSLLASACYAAEYLHETQVVNSDCRNLSVSTRVGYMSNNTCVYVAQETPSRGYDICGPFQLNAFVLEQMVGPGYACAATHVHANATGKDGLW